MTEWDKSSWESGWNSGGASNSGVCGGGWQSPLAWAPPAGGTAAGSNWGWLAPPAHAPPPPGAQYLNEAAHLEMVFFGKGYQKGLNEGHSAGFGKGYSEAMDTHLGYTRQGQGFSRLAGRRHRSGWREEEEAEKGLGMGGVEEEIHRIEPRPDYPILFHEARGKEDCDLPPRNPRDDLGGGGLERT